MNNKHYVGKRISAFEEYNDIGPITGVALLVDDENEIVAGDEKGYMLEISCPYGTEAMAANILESLQGKTYQGFRAENALLSPAAELGDGVTVHGGYYLLAHRTVNFGPGHMSEIEAPGENEPEHEYIWTSPKQKEFNRKIAQTRSLISKTSEDIRLEVQGVEEALSYIQLDLDSISGRVADAEGNIGALELTATQLTAAVEGKIDGTDAQALIDLSLDGLTLSVSNGATSSTISLKAGDTTIDSATVKFTGVVTFSDLEDAPGRGDTTIHGGWIDTDTLFATNLMGEYIYLLDEDEADAGTIRITDASSADAAVEILSYGALRLVAESGAVYLEAGGESLTIDYVQGNGYTIAASTDFIPNDSGWLDLGLYDYQWRNIYASQSYAEAAEADTSDRNKKNSISYDLSRYDGFFDKLMPAIYKLNNGTSGRLHMGMIAQDVEQALADCTIPTTDFAGFIKIGDSYALRYGEFISLLIWQVQQLKSRVKQLEVRV